MNVSDNLEEDKKGTGVMTEVYHESCLNYSVQMDTLKGHTLGRCSQMLKGNPGQTEDWLFSTMGRTKLYVKGNQYYGTKKGGGSMENAVIIWWYIGRVEEECLQWYCWTCGHILGIIEGRKGEREWEEKEIWWTHVMTTKRRQCRNISLLVLVMVFCKTLWLLQAHWHHSLVE